MCKSNQYQSLANIFNVTVTRKQPHLFLPLTATVSCSALMKVTPHDGPLELHPSQRSINLSCTVRELDAQPIDPLKIKWYHNRNEINYQRSSHVENKYAHNNQATLILYIHNLALNDSGLFTCDYNQGVISKNVQITYTSSGRTPAFHLTVVERFVSLLVLEYSRSMSSELPSTCSLLAAIQIIIFILR